MWLYRKLLLQSLKEGISEHCSFGNNKIGVQIKKIMAFLLLISSKAPDFSIMKIKTLNTHHEICLSIMKFFDRPQIVSKSQLDFAALRFIVSKEAKSFIF